MTMKQRLTYLALSAAAAVLFYTGAAVASDLHALKVGKTGDVTFSTVTKAGPMTFKPGRYKLQHRVNGTDHFIHFTEMTKASPPNPSAPTERAHPGEVKCEIEMADKKFSQTRLLFAKDGDAMRLVRIEVAGENVAHILKPAE